MFGQNLLGTFILLVHHFLDFFVNEFGGLFAIWTVERIFFIIIITQVRQLVAHT